MVPPTGRNSRSCQQRRNLHMQRQRHLAISSKRTDPALRHFEQAFFVAVAPVNEPRRWRTALTPTARREGGPVESDEWGATLRKLWSCTADAISSVERCRSRRRSARWRRWGAAARARPERVAHPPRLVTRWNQMTPHPARVSARRLACTGRALRKSPDGDARAMPGRPRLSMSVNAPRQAPPRPGPRRVSVTTRTGAWARAPWHAATTRRRIRPAGSTRGVPRGGARGATAPRRRRPPHETDRIPRATRAPQREGRQQEARGR